MARQTRDDASALASERSAKESGNTLILALVIIIIVAVAGASVLNQISSGSRVQTAYKNLRDNELAKADSGLDDFVQSMRYDPTAGIDGGTGGCHDSNTASAWEPVATLPGSLTVYCKPFVGSGKLLNGVGTSPPNSVLTLAGAALTTGGVYGANNSPPPQVPYWYPFCEDYHDYQQGGHTDRCEAGLFVGRGTDPANASGTGGLKIAWNGNQNTALPVVVSNSSIITGTGPNSTIRQLQVGGDLWARYDCAGGYDASSLLTWFPAAIVMQAGAKHCKNGGAIAGQSDTLTPDPDYVHAPLDLSAMCPAVPGPGSELCVPRVDANAASPYTLQPGAICNNNGLVTMPAKQIGTTGYYTAWYDSATSLNAVMQDTSNGCPDSLFWFRPGIYYFDFLDKTAATGWLAPQPGCIYLEKGTCANPPSEIVGGTPSGWYSTCAPPCAQPAHVLQPNIYEKDIDPHASWTHSGWATAIDDRMAEAVAYDNSGGSPVVPYRNLEVPLPERSGTTVQSVKLELSYALPSGSEPGALNPPSFYYKKGPDMNNATPGGQLDISSNKSGGDCFIRLPLGSANLGNDGNIPPHANFQINLTDGCSQNIPGYDHASGSFPCSKNCGAGTQVITVGATESVWKDHPDWVNQLGAEFTFAAAGGLTSSDPARGIVDGMQFNVGYTGRPVPTFPNGCDPTSSKGVQFIFGHTARMQFGEGGTEQAFAELCANATSAFPSASGATSYAISDGTNRDYTTASGSQYPIAIYGMAEDMAPPRLTANTRPAAAGTTVPVPIKLVGFPDTSSNPAWTSTHGVVNTPAEADFNNIGDGNYAYTSSWPASSGAPATLAFRLGDGTASGLICGTTTSLSACNAAGKIPAGSTITNVRVKVAHSEGAIVAGLLEPGSGIQAASQGGVSLDVNPGSTAQGANGYQSSPWSTNDTNILSNNTFTCTNSSGTNCNMVPAGTPNGSQAACNAVHQARPPVMCTFEWGLADMPPPSSGATWAEPVSGGGKDWTIQRSLTDQLSTVEGISNAEFTLKFKQANSAVGREAWVDGVEVYITYRPAGEVRPVDGCLTTRTQWRPGDLLGSNALGYDWVDEDWGATSNATELRLDGDTAAGDFGTNATNEPSDDDTNCPLVDIAPVGKVKFHVAGMIYAPSAPLALSGNDNDSQWVTLGIIARHLSAVRWKNGGDLAAIGDAEPYRDDRHVRLEVRDSNGNVLARTTVDYLDMKRMNGGLGHQVKVGTWIRNP
jgi:hypothetical protein